MGSDTTVRLFRPINAEVKNVFSYVLSEELHLNACDAILDPSVEPGEPRQGSEVTVGRDRRKATGSHISHLWLQLKQAEQHLQTPTVQQLCLTKWPSGSLSLLVAASSADVSCDSSRAAFLPRGSGGSLLGALECS